ncbi:PKD domain-containing protein [Flavobacteriaceae bacterium]|nr:PKD domain-containing protein [Flavobacteriaceae bacterium]
MKTINKFFTLLFVFTAFVSCKEDFLEETDFGIVAPSNVNATFNITQDNTGLVTITPTAVGAIKFDVDFGDGSEIATGIAAGKHVKHTFTEATHSIGITAIGLGNLKTAASVELMVSFKAPQNLVVAMTNSTTVSRQVDVVATADYATTFDVSPGVDGAEDVSANIGETASYKYDAAGTYTITVTAKGGAIETTSFSQDFEVTALMQPVASAPTPKDRPSSSVISVYSSSYAAQAVTNFNGFPDWGQGGQGSSWAEFDLNGDKMLQYVNLSYQGNQFDAVDLSGMEYVHMDVWTADVDKLELSIIQTAIPQETPIVTDLVKDEWNSIDIPLSSFTDLGQAVTAIDQLKYVGTPWAAGSVFIDNVYFYKASEVKLPIRFDQEEKFAGVGGASVELSTDPDDATNNTAKVTNGGNDWETAEIMLDVPISITSGGDNKYSVRIYSPDDAAHALMMKLEESGANEFIELSQPFQGKGWNTVNFDFSTITAQAWPNPGAAWDGNADFKKLVFFIDGGSSTPGVYHLDDVALNSQLYGLPIYFNDALIPFAGVGGASFEMSTDPDDATNNTGKLTNGGNDWETAELILERPISIVSGADNSFFVDIYSPDDAEHGLMMKLEQSGANEYIELAKTFKGKGWNTVHFDMSTVTAQAWPNPGAEWDGNADFKKLVFFVDGGSATPGVYHFDNIEKRPAVGLPIDFSTTIPFKGVGGAAFEFSTDPDDATNATGKVTNGGNDWETAELILDVPISITSGGDNKYSVRIYSPDAAAHKLMMKLEQSGANEYIELSQDFQGAGWNTVTFDMSTVGAQAWPNPGAEWDGTADFKKLVFFIDGGSATPGVYHLDDIIKN